MNANTLRDMLMEYDPAWEDHFLSLREAAEYYGLEGMLEYHELLHGAGTDEPYMELDFND